MSKKNRKGLFKRLTEDILTKALWTITIAIGGYIGTISMYTYNQFQKIIMLPKKVDGIIETLETTKKRQFKKDLKQDKKIEELDKVKKNK